MQAKDPTRTEDEQRRALPIRITPARRRVLNELLEATSATYGLKIAQATDLNTGTVSTVLADLQRAGWVAGRREQVDPWVVCRPRRRYYRLTKPGRLKAEALLRRSGLAGRKVRLQGTREASGSLADIRRTRGLTQRALAARMRVSRARVSTIERGGDLLQLSTLLNYGRALGARIEVRVVFGGETFILAAVDGTGDDRNAPDSETAPPNR
jgi:PadR family transcriptional regulator